VTRPKAEPEERRGLFPGALEMMVLQTLRGRPLHGYAIAQHIQQTSDELLQIEEGTLYPALQRLLREGWVVAEWGVSRTNRRVRIYKITAAGRKQLQREMSSFERMLEGIARVMRPSET
jgi:PadR family transcriptional regulator, regulatory protein PadR